MFPDWNKGFRKILLLMGLITEKEIEFTIEYGDVISFAADTVAVKYAQGFYGVSSAIAQSLDKIGIKWEDLRSQIGSYKYIDDTKGAIASHHALFVGTPPLLDFGYRQIREFSSIVLNILSNEDPDIKHLAMPIHGVGYGLDEVESVLSQFEGIIDTMQTGKLPIYLKRISIVEANYARVQRVREALEKKLDNTEYASKIKGGEWGYRIRLIVKPENEYDYRYSKDLRITDLKPNPAEAKPLVFVAMPFEKNMEDVFYYGIQGPTRNLGFLCERIDNESFTGDILDRVKKRIEQLQW